MTHLIKTILKVTTKKDKPPLVQIEINGNSFNVSRKEISSDLKIEDGIEVEYERIRGRPEKIRIPGQTFIPPQDEPLVALKHKSQRRNHRTAFQNNTDSIIAGDFHNPYNFVPAPPRINGNNDLDDKLPVSQDCFHKGLFTGRITVGMETTTPLLLPDTANVHEQNGHKTFDIRVDENGLPSIPASSVRGMLRTAYEIITNSRFQSFQHKERLAFRMNPREAVKLIPARIETNPKGDLEFKLLTGKSTIKPDGSPGGAMYAAWLHRYQNGHLSPSALTYPGATLPEHGDSVECWIEQFAHHRWHRNQNRHIQDFLFYKVRTITRAGSSSPAKPAPTALPARRNGQSFYQPIAGSIDLVSGYVCITNANTNRKHDEKVFFQNPSSSHIKSFSCKEKHKELWRQLIHNYQVIHKDEIEQRRIIHHCGPEVYMGNDPGQTAWSRHVYNDSYLSLQPGTLCYVQLNNSHSDVEAVFPVMISRELFSVSPWDLLHKSLKPAETAEQLSPVDRVFGWVDKSGRGAHRGQIKIGPVKCQAERPDFAVERFDNALPLGILSTPKPQQSRFYVAESVNGEKQCDGIQLIDAGYSPNKGLRGRKVFPHHAGITELHWKSPFQQHPQNGRNFHYKEYRRPLKNGVEQYDSQNRSILGWVKCGTVFEFDILVENLSEVEIGALLWLLTLEKKHNFRLGGGKPFGFGSVHIKIHAFDVCDGVSLKKRYLSWTVPSKSECSVDKFVNQYKDTIIKTYEKKGFETVPFVSAFLKSCEGYTDNLPVRYPRTGNGPPNPDGEAFKWFVQNERQNKLSLGNLTDDPGLPMY
jgi:CRISPR-associated protein (TIGR03986 family)